MLIRLSGLVSGLKKQIEEIIAGVLIVDICLLTWCLVGGFQSYLLPTLLFHHVSVEWEVVQLGGFRTPTFGHRSALPTPSFIHAAIASSSTVWNKEKGWGWRLATGHFFENRFSSHQTIQPLTVHQRLFQQLQPFPRKKWHFSLNRTQRTEEPKYYQTSLVCSNFKLKETKIQKMFKWTILQLQ